MSVLVEIVDILVAEPVLLTRILEFGDYLETPPVTRETVDNNLVLLKKWHREAFNVLLRDWMGRANENCTTTALIKVLKDMKCKAAYEKIQGKFPVKTYLEEEKKEKEPKLNLLSNILSFINGRTVLRYRLVSKYWNEEVLHAYSSSEEKSTLFFRTFPYLKQLKEGKENAFKLPSNSPLTKMLNLSDNIHCYYTPTQILAFIRERPNVEVIDMEIVGNALGKLSWGQAFSIIFKENLLPNLREITLKMYGTVGHIKWPVDAGAGSFTLPSLRKLEIGDSKEHPDPNFLQFLQAIVDNSPLLSDLTIYGLYYPIFKENSPVRKLVLDSLRTVPDFTNIIPQIERVLTEIRSFLEEFNLFLTMQGNRVNFSQQNFRLPKMPKLRKYKSPAFSPIPFPNLVEGDFLSVLVERLPSLEFFMFGCIGELIGGEQQDVFASAFSRGEKRHERLKVIKIPKPESERFYSGIKERLPNLKVLNVCDRKGRFNVDLNKY